MKKNAIQIRTGTALIVILTLMVIACLFRQCFGIDGNDPSTITTEENIMIREICTLETIQGDKAVVRNTKEELFQLSVDETFGYGIGEKMWISYTENNKKEIAQGLYEVIPDTIFPSETSETVMFK